MLRCSFLINVYPLFLKSLPILEKEFSLLTYFCLHSFFAVFITLQVFALFNL